MHVVFTLVLESSITLHKNFDDNKSILIEWNLGGTVMMIIGVINCMAVAGNSGES